jgi:hypothetical protein
MIDNPDQVERLTARLSDTLPLPASATPRLMATLRGRSGTTMITPPCTVTKVYYAGNEGGIVCHLSFKETTGSEVVVASITHLEFDRRLHIAREILAYQKHRTKRLRREGGFGSPLIGLH